MEYLIDLSNPLLSTRGVTKTYSGIVIPIKTDLTTPEYYSVYRRLAPLKIINE